MNVVPDLLPSLHPSIDLRLNFPEAPPEDPVRRSRTKGKLEKVEPGIYLLPEQVCGTTYSARLSSLHDYRHANRRTFMCPFSTRSLGCIR